MDRWDQVAIAMADCRKFHHNLFPTSSSSITNCEDGYEEHLEGEFLVVCDTQIPLLMYHPLIIYCRRFFPSRKCNMLGVCILAFRGKVEMPVLVLNKCGLRVYRGTLKSTLQSDGTESLQADCFSQYIICLPAKVQIRFRLYWERGFKPDCCLTLKS